VTWIGTSLYAPKGNAGRWRARTNIAERPLRSGLSRSKRALPGGYGGGSRKENEGERVGSEDAAKVRYFTSDSIVERLNADRGDGAKRGKTQSVKVPDAPAGPLCRGLSRRPHSTELQEKVGRKSRCSGFLKAVVRRAREKAGDLTLFSKFHEKKR